MKRAAKKIPLLIMLLAVVIAGGKLSAGPVIRPTAHWLLKGGVWVPLVPANKTTPEGRVALMIRNFNNHHYGRVIDQSHSWLHNKALKNNPLIPEVLLLQGDAFNAIGEKYAALFPYEDLLDNFPSSDLYGPCLQREYNIAQAFLHGYKRRFLGLRILPVYGDALRLLRRIQDRQRGSPLAELSGITVADYYYKDGRFQRSFQSYSDFLRRYPYSQFVVKATVRQCEALLATFRGVRFDMTPLHNAQAELETLQQEYPQQAVRIQAKAIEARIYDIEGRKELQIARFYIRFSHPKSAEFYYKRVIAGWPDTIWATKARRELIRHFGKEASP